MKLLQLLILFLAFLLHGCGCSIVDPGHRGVKVHLGEVTPTAFPEGLVWHLPLLTSIRNISVQQETWTMKAECYSSDLQQVSIDLKVLYRIPEANVVKIFRDYGDKPFESLVAPRVQESMKEVTALQTAENIVKKREQMKIDVLKLVKQKLDGLLIVEDVVIENETLSKELETAIESKMVQQQEAAKAEFLKQKATVEAETALIRAKGEASALDITGQALKNNPQILTLEMIKKWNGIAPQALGNTGTLLQLPGAK